MSDELKLGDEVKDKVTGFKGVTIAKCDYLNGCVCYEVQPRCTPDGKMPQAIWIDIQQLEIVKKPRKKKATNKKRETGRRGGPADRPPSRSTPSISNRGQGYHDERYSRR